MKKDKGSILVILMVVLFVIVLGLLTLYVYFSNKAASNIWKGITPGKTTKAEVSSKLGNPQKEIDMPFSKGLIYPSGVEIFPNIVVYDEKTNVVEGSFVMVVDKNEQKNLYSQLSKLGTPEKTMYSSYSAQSKIYIFASRGITFSADDISKIVDGAHYYQPMTLSNYISKYGSYFYENNPYKY